MENKIDIKPLFSWAVNNGEAKIIDRILVKLMPELLKQNIKIDQNILNDKNSFLVNESIYNKIKDVTEQLVDKKFEN